MCISHVHQDVCTVCTHYITHSNKRRKRGGSMCVYHTCITMCVMYVCMSHICMCDINITHTSHTSHNVSMYASMSKMVQSALRSSLQKVLQYFRREGGNKTYPFVITDFFAKITMIDKNSRAQSAIT